MWTNQADRLVLASASPRRLQLLEQIKVPVEQLVLPVHGEDEPRIDDESVLTYVSRTAHDKLNRAQAHWTTHRTGDPMPPILAADTTVAKGQVILGKPSDAAEARYILSELAGQAHEVYTAVVLSHHGKTYETVVQAVVEFDAVLNDVIADYIETGEPFGKAGAYGIQGIAAAYIKSVSGSYSAVVGLPLYETAQLLRQAGLYQ